MVRIALSKGIPESKYANYYRWMGTDQAGVTCVDIYHFPDDSVLAVLSACDGLLLTGGADIDPSRYGRGGDSARCLDVNRRLDSLEILMVMEAVKSGMPILGICRGQQLLNVALGGSLVVDIPSDRPSPVAHQCEDYIKCFHPVTLAKGSLLYGIAGGQPDTVTTNHHQAVDRLAPGLSPVAWSSDGLIEALEWADPEGRSFLLGVQWHPERMTRSSPLSLPLRDKFLQEARKYAQNKIK